MKKILGILVVFVFSLVITSQTNQVFAEDCTGFTMTGNLGGTFEEGDTANKIEFELRGINNEEKEFGFFTKDGVAKAFMHASAESGVLSFSTSEPNIFVAGEWYITFKKKGSLTSGSCRLGTYTVTGPECKTVYVYQKEREDSEALGHCFYDPNGGCIDEITNIWITSEVVNPGGSPYTKEIWHQLSLSHVRTGDPNEYGGVTLDHGRLSEGSYTVKIQTEWLGKAICSYDFEVQRNCDGLVGDVCKESPPTDSDRDPETGEDVFTLCTQISAETQRAQYDACIECAGGVDEEGKERKEGIWTAVGCIKREPQAIIQRFIRIGLGIAGGFTLITFLAAGFIFSTSQGSPEKVKSAKEMMTASITGLMFVLFSVTILQFIGRSVLKIPGFGE